jgi:hypothetical protein
MDGANKQTAIVTEATQGTIPATPRLEDPPRHPALGQRHPQCRALAGASLRPHGCQHGDRHQRLRLLDRDAVPAGRRQRPAPGEALANTWSTDALKNASTSGRSRSRRSTRAASPTPTAVGRLRSTASRSASQRWLAGQHELRLRLPGRRRRTRRQSAARPMRRRPPATIPSARSTSRSGPLLDLVAEDRLSFNMNIRNNLRQQYASALPRRGAPASAPSTSRARSRSTSASPRTGARSALPQTG